MPASVRLDGLIAARRASILQVFVREIAIRGFATPQATPAEIARPADACVTALIRAVGSGRSEPSAALSLAHEYADQRIRLGYDLRALLVEFGLLRGIVVDALGASCPPEGAERIAGVLHDVMVEAALRFAGRTTVAKAFTSAA